MARTLWWEITPPASREMVIDLNTLGNFHILAIIPENTLNHWIKATNALSSGKIEFSQFEFAASKASKVPKILHQQSPMNKLKPCKYSKYSEIRRKFKCCIHRIFKWCIALNQPSSKYSISNMHIIYIICLKHNTCYLKKISPYFAYMLYWGGGCICSV